MKTMVLILITIISFGAIAQNGNDLTFKFERGEKGLFFPLNEADKLFTFQVSGINLEQKEALVLKALDYDGVLSFELRQSHQPGVFMASASFLPNTSYEFFEGFFQYLQVKHLHIEDMDICPATNVYFTVEQYEQLEMLNYQINQIQTKIDWTWENFKDKATENGWFDDAYNNLSLAKEAKRSFLENIK